MIEPRMSPSARSYDKRKVKCGYCGLREPVEELVIKDNKLRGYSAYHNICNSLVRNEYLKRFQNLTALRNNNDLSRETKLKRLFELREEKNEKIDKLYVRMQAYERVFKARSDRYFLRLKREFSDLNYINNYINNLSMNPPKNEFLTGPNIIMPKGLMQSAPTM